MSLDCVAFCLFWFLNWHMDTTRIDGLLDTKSASEMNFYKHCDK